jgi:hypothetical protein
MQARKDVVGILLEKPISKRSFKRPRVNWKITSRWIRGKYQSSVYEISFHLRTIIYDAQSQDSDGGNARSDVIMTSSEAKMV